MGERKGKATRDKRDLGPPRRDLKRRKKDERGTTTIAELASREDASEGDETVGADGTEPQNCGVELEVAVRTKTEDTGSG